MQHWQPHIPLYWSDILFSWGDIILCSVESLMMILLSVSLAYLSLTSYGGIIIPLLSSQTETCNNSFVTSCVSAWPPIDNFRQSFDIGDSTTWGCCII